MSLSVAAYRDTWTEAEFAAAVLACAEESGWRVNYVPDWLWKLVFARGPRYGRDWPEPGWPDLVLCRVGAVPELIIAELKTKTGHVRSPQLAWLADLKRCGIETHVWRPKDYDAIEERLAPREGRSCSD